MLKEVLKFLFNWNYFKKIKIQFNVKFFNLMDFNGDGLLSDDEILDLDDNVIYFFHIYKKQF